LILDIDNTIANTWVYLKNKQSETNISYKDIPVLSKTLDHIATYYATLPIVFLSHRNVMTFNETSQWLNQKITKKEHLLVLVSNPYDKLYYINMVLKKSKVIYYDDLSYNHEKGIVFFYDKIINEVKKLDLIYYDYEFIKELNQNISHVE
tara:strand:+ start:683 stop:1132 length:450 start_codon:yes stop_codon:yes gene_type:complete